jgi:hypothetical protein
VQQPQAENAGEGKRGKTDGFMGGFNERARWTMSKGKGPPSARVSAAIGICSVFDGVDNIHEYPQHDLRETYICPLLGDRMMFTEMSG